MRSKSKRGYYTPFLGALILALGLQLTYVPKSEALIGLIFRNRTVKTIGGIGALAGGTMTGVGLLSASAGADLGSVIVGASVAYWGVLLAGVGIIILDDHRVADIEFRMIDPNRPEDFKGFTRAEVEIYNSEVELLNAVRQRISKEVDENADTTSAERLWVKYENFVSAETFAIAKAKAKVFVSAL